MTAKKIVKLGEAKASLERKKYKALVLDTFDRLDRTDKRELAEKRAEVERKARNTF